MSKIKDQIEIDSHFKNEEADYFARFNQEAEKAKTIISQDWNHE